MWSVKFEVWSAKSAVCSVRCGVSREGHGRDRVSLNYRSFMFGKLPPPACPRLCYVLLLANLLAFYLTYLLAFYLAYLLAYLLAFFMAYLLQYVLAYLLAFYLTYLLTLYLAYLLVFYLAVEVQQCTQSWEGPRLRSSGAH